jgi:hypothetical protein
MNFSVLLVLLIILDIFEKPFILITAIIQYSIFSILHVNSYFFSKIINFLRNSSFIAILCILFSFWFFEIAMHLLALIYFNLLVYTLISSVPRFFKFDSDEKILADATIIQRLQHTFKISIKLIITCVSIYGCDLLKSALFVIWIILSIYKNCPSRTIIQPIKPHNKPVANLSELSITEQELIKLRKIYSADMSKENSSFKLDSKTK